MQKKRSFVLLKFFNWTKWINRLGGEDNIENDIDTIEPGLGEINVDKTLTGNECDDKQSLQKFFEANGALLIRMLFAHITRESDVSTGTEGQKYLK